MPIGHRVGQSGRNKLQPYPLKFWRQIMLLFSCYSTWFCLTTPFRSYSAVLDYPEAGSGAESSKFSRGDDSNKFLVFYVGVIFPMSSKELPPLKQPTRAEISTHLL